MGVVFGPPTLLSRVSPIQDFDCGKPVLNDWLKRYALIAMSQNSSQTFVSLASSPPESAESLGEQVAGYYSLATGQIFPSDASARVKKGLGRHPIPVAVLTRLAVDLRFQGQGLGRGLMRDCAQRVMRVSNEIGIRAILTQALDEDATSFYRGIGFESSPLKSSTLMILIKDLRRYLEVRD